MKIKTILLGLTLLSSKVLWASTPPCPLPSGINVNTAKHLLNICKKGTVVKSFKVALGYKGIGKKRTGDNKTPIGLYNLSAPRKSSQFKIFIPILYPTAKQVAAGYTGRDVGLHGPTQSSLTWLSNLPSATRGCIAVGKNNPIEYVAKWVTPPPGTKVLII